MNLLKKLNDSFNPLSEVNRLKARAEVLGYKDMAMKWMREKATQVLEGIYSEIFGADTPPKEIEAKMNKANVSTQVVEGSEEQDGEPYRLLSDGLNMKEFQQQLRKDLLPRFNDYRKECAEDLPEMTLSEDLCTSARRTLLKNIQSETWRKEHYHTDDIENGSVGEITTSGFESIEDALKNFLSSPLHRWYLRRGFTKMGYAAVQDEAGRWYLNVHMTGAEPEQAPEEMKIGDKRDLDEKEVAFLDTSSEKTKKYWEDRDIELDHLPDEMKTFLKKQEKLDARMKWMVSELEALRKNKYDWVKMQAEEKLTESILKKSSNPLVVVSLKSSNSEKQFYVLDSTKSYAAELEVNEVKDGDKVNYNATLTKKKVALDLMFEGIIQK